MKDVNSDHFTGFLFHGVKCDQHPNPNSKKPATM